MSMQPPKFKDVLGDIKSYVETGTGDLNTIWTKLDEDIAAETKDIKDNQIANKTAIDEKALKRIEVLFQNYGSFFAGEEPQNKERLKLLIQSYQKKYNTAAVENYNDGKK